AVEWRVINAADYGFAQKRRRVFLFAFHESTKHYQGIVTKNLVEIIHTEGIFAKTFPLKEGYNKRNEFSIGIPKFKDLVEVSNRFTTTIYNSGILISGNVYTEQTSPIEEPFIPLRNVLERNVGEIYYINDDTKF